MTYAFLYLLGMLTYSFVIGLLWTPITYKLSRTETAGSEFVRMAGPFIWPLATVVLLPFLVEKGGKMLRNYILEEETTE